jgi:glyoxylase-like metal-dependent hydrolase (beta-lactamase superfamily II)
MRAAARAAAVAAVTGMLSALAGAEPARPVLDVAAARLDVDRIGSLTFEATGRYFQFSQAPAPDLPWPPFDVDGYVATLDYSRATVHARYRRVQVVEAGRARPPADQTMDQYFADGIAWNLVPAPSAMPTNVAERQAELWTSPQGFVRAARANGARLQRTAEGALVTFRIGKFPFEGLLNDAGEVLRVRTLMSSPVLGDVPIEWRFSNYRDFGGARFPAHIARFAAGLPWYALDVNAVRVNDAQVIAVPAEVAADPAPAPTNIVETELAPGVINFGGVTHNTVVVRQDAGIVVIEAPLDESRSRAVLDRIRVRFGDVPLLGVINTHAHFDHAGGLRAFIAAGVPVITLARNADYYARAWKNPRTLEPDTLSRAPRKPVFRTFTSRLDLPDRAHPIVLHAIEGSGHNDAFAMAWLPSDRLLVEADAWTPAPAGSPPPVTINPLWSNLRQNVERLRLPVERVQPLHGNVQPWSALVSATGG